MLVNSPYVGDWMGSAYTSRGTRVDVHLCLNPDGTFERITRQDPDFERLERGRWHHQEGDDVMQLEPDPPEESCHGGTLWRVLTVSTLADSNCVLVLRQIEFASRDVPILFTRVHLPGRWYSKREGIAA